VVLAISEVQRFDHLREHHMKMTIAGAEQVACTIFERLGLELAGAQLDYESFNGIHNFIITDAGTRFGSNLPSKRCLQKVWSS